MNGDPEPDAEIVGTVGKHDDAPTCTTPPPTCIDEVIDGFPVWLGTYRRDERLGQGGMGVVFRYRDTRLDRLVAVKTISTRHAGDPVWRQRFEREARLLAKLDHPHIAKIFHLLEHGGMDYLILEYVPGDTLQARLYDGPLAMETALRVAHQIASAIAAGHSQGIVHRDIKPGNVMVTALDAVKILDYGLARPQPETGRPGLRPRDRNAVDDRAEGSASELWGTPGYMSPEQASGEAVDHRTDVWALGCVLYDCLTGKRAFPGNRHQRNIATLTREPDWSLLPSDTPANIRQMLEECLCKDVSQRLPNLDEACVELEHAATSVGPRRSVREIPGNLTTPLTSYIEREGEIEWLKRLLHSNRLLTLTGPGGCGKTRLSIALAEAIRCEAGADARDLEYADGVWFVGLAALTSPDLVPQAVAAALWGTQGLSRTKGRTVLDELADDLGDRRLLLVMDNCEHLVPGCVALVDRLLTRCPQVKFIATSRIGLGVTGEQTYPVPGLSFPGQGADTETGLSEFGSAVTSDVTAFEAARLFIERASRAQPNFALDPTNAAAISQICQRLEGIPLAVELAAARVRSLPVTDIANRLFEVLDREHILEASIASSVDMLDTAPRTLLTRLSVFRSGWTLEAAETICSDKPKRLTVKRRPVVELLSDLIDRSLVTYEVRDDRARYHLLETVREYASRQLKPKAAISQRRRHLDHYLAVAEEADQHFGGPEQVAWLNRLETEHPNMRAALRFGREGSGESVSTVRLAKAMYEFWRVRGYFAEARAWLEFAVGCRSQANDILQIRILNALATIAARQGDVQFAIVHYEKAVEIARDLGDRRRLAGVLTNLGTAAEAAGDWPRCQGCHEDSIAAYEALQDRTGVAAAQLNYAVALLRHAGWIDPQRSPLIDQAATLLGECLPLFKQAGDEQRIAAASENLGRIACQRGETDEAEVLIKRSLAIWRVMQHKEATADSIEWLGVNSARTGDYDRSARMLAAAEQIRAACNTARPDVHSEQVLATVRAQLGEDGFRRSWDTGAAMTYEETVSYALGES